jgi:E3 ubiquitin-protein ligase TRIP12
VRFRKRSDLFRVLGQFVAKALLDSRIIDVSFNRTFLKLIMGEEVTRSVDSLMVRRRELKVTSYPADVFEFQDVDPALASSLRRVQQYANAQAEIKADLSLVCRTAL